MRIRFLAFTCVASLITHQAVAQSSQSLMQDLATSAHVQALIAKAKSELKNGQSAVNETILQLAPYRISLEYRALPNNPSVHETEDELIYIIDGAGTLTVGGTLVGEKRTNQANLSGTAIQGGTDIHVSKGDFYIVPKNTPHMFAPLGGPLVDMSLHLPAANSAQ